MAGAAAMPEEDLVRLYLNDVGRHPLLTKADEGVLGRLVQAGLIARAEMDCTEPSRARRRELLKVIAEGDVATQTFVQSNLRLVVSIAKKYRSSVDQMDLLDLIQEGNLGLLHAVDQVKLVNRTRSDLATSLGRTPTAEEVADAIGMPVDKVRETGDWARTPISIDEPITDDGDDRRGDFIADGDAVDPMEAALSAAASADVDKALDVLDDRERAILRMRYGLDGRDPLTLEQVGVAFSLTRERIRQIEVKALSKLRHPSQAERFMSLALP